MEPEYIVCFGRGEAVLTVFKFFERFLDEFSYEF